LNNAKNVSDAHVMTFTGFNYFDYVELALDTAADFNSPEYQHFIISKTAITSYYGKPYFKNLYFGQKYYWRIRDLVGPDTSGWSKAKYFTTFDVPGLVSPSNQSTSMPLKVYLQNDNLAGNSTYQYEIDTTLSFNSPRLHRDTASGKYFQVSGFSYNTHYYWRLRAYNKKDTSQWSVAYSFTTEPRETPHGITPTDKSTQQPTVLLFAWENNNQLYTRMELDTANTFSSPAILRDSIPFPKGTNTLFSYDTMQPLYYAQKYYWRIKHIYSNDSTNWSNPMTFTTYTSPALNYPYDKQLLYDVGTNLEVKPLLGASGYIWELDTSSKFNSPILRSGDSTGTTFETGDEFYFGKTYYWRAKAYNAIDTSEWSMPYTFITKDTLFLYSPANKSTGISNKTQLQWSRVLGASGYQYLLGTDPNFKTTKPVTVYGDATDQSSVIIGYGGNYFWKVRAFDKNDTSSWSARWSFNTRQAPVIYAPILVTPKNRDTDVDIPNGDISFNWNSNGEPANSYDFQLASDLAFSNILIDKSVTSPYAVIAGAKEGQTFYWRVRTHADTLVSAWSGIFRFRTHITTGITVNEQSPEDISIYPNPSNHMFFIKHTGTSIQSIQLFDIHGQLQQLVINPDKDLIEIDADGWAPGIYLLRLVTPENTIVKQIIKQ
jgi:hypothetical protein